MKNWYEFFHDQHALRGKKKGKERKKRKEISSQITSKHYTHAIQRRRGYQDKSNDLVESRLQLPKPAARAARRQWSV